MGRSLETVGRRGPITSSKVSPFLGAPRVLKSDPPIPPPGPPFMPNFWVGRSLETVGRRGPITSSKIFPNSWSEVKRVGKGECHTPEYHTGIELIKPCQNEVFRRVAFSGIPEEIVMNGEKGL